MLRMTTDDFVGEALRRDIEEEHTETGVEIPCDRTNPSAPLFKDPLESKPLFMSQSRVESTIVPRRANALLDVRDSSDQSYNNGLNLLSYANTKSPSYKRWAHNRWAKNVNKTDMATPNLQRDDYGLEETLRELASECTRTRRIIKRGEFCRTTNNKSSWVGQGRNGLNGLMNRYEAKVLVDHLSFSDSMGGMSLPEVELPTPARGGSSESSLKLLRSLRSPQINNDGEFSLFATSADNLDAIQGRMRSLIDSMPSGLPVYRFTLVVPRREIGRIIGRGGEYVKALGKVSGVSIHVSQPVILQNVINGNVGMNERLLIITSVGKSGLRMAVKSILRRLNEVDEFCLPQYQCPKRTVFSASSSSSSRSSFESARSIYISDMRDECVMND